MRVKTKWPFYLLGLLFSLILISNFIVINVSASVPLGIYWYDRSPGFKSGDYVLIPNAAVSEWTKYMASNVGGSIIKNIAALPGNKYKIKNRILSADNLHVTIMETTTNGKPLPQIPDGDYIVKQGYFLPIANGRPNSFDGRYMGELPLTVIKAKLIPIWLFD